MIKLPQWTTPGYAEWVEHITGRSWPTVITGPGEYITRGGKRVIINSCPRISPSSFKAEGSLIVREKPRRTEWSTWKTNGQWQAMGESQHDIVGRWPGAQRTGGPTASGSATLPAADGGAAEPASQ